MTRNPPPLQVGLAGPSGSGKTAFSEKVQDFMPGGLPLCFTQHAEAFFAKGRPPTAVCSVCVSDWCIRAGALPQAVRCCPWTTTTMPAASLMGTLMVQTLLCLHCSGLMILPKWSTMCQSYEHSRAVVSGSGSF